MTSDTNSPSLSNVLRPPRPDPGKSRTQILVICAGVSEKLAVLLYHLQFVPGFQLSALVSPFDLLDQATDSARHVVILDDSLTPRELDSSTRTVRLRWPSAKIIVIRTGEEFLEDHLYDVRVFPGIEPQQLTLQIQQML